MATNTVRSVVIFSIIAVGFIGLTAGGMFFLKSRNHSLVTAQNKPQPVAQQPSQSQKSDKKEVARTDNKSKPADTSKAEAKPADTSKTTESSQPAANAAPATDNTKPASQTTEATVAPTSVPATGPSLPSIVATTILMMAAAFFGSQLLRARSAYRRHLEG